MLKNILKKEKKAKLKIEYSFKDLVKGIIKYSKKNDNQINKMKKLITKKNEEVSYTSFSEKTKIKTFNLPIIKSKRFLVFYYFSKSSQKNKNQNTLVNLSASYKKSCYSEKKKKKKSCL